jgi:2-aminoadipate transaminase
MQAVPQLDPTLEEPLYRQLYLYFREEIVSGRLSRGEKLPPTRELAGQLGLNRATVASAYELLENEGLIRGHVGRGSFVDGPGTGAGPLRWSERLADPLLPEPLAPAPVAAPGGISFTSARPSDELFPLADFRATCAEVIGGPEATQILQLGSPQGYAPLRAHLLEQARVARQARPADDVLITNGCQQALDLLQRLLTSAGDTILTEDPIYPGLKNLFLRAGVRVAGVPVGEQGIDIEALDRLIARERPRLLIVTPNFQNPTGATLPLAAREALLRLAGAAALPVIENDIYGELRYQGEPLPTLKELDTTGLVIQIRSFSKIAFPGLRVGWVIAPSLLIERLAEWKQSTDLHSDQLSQAVLLRFAESGRLAEHVGRMVESGRERLHAVLAACERHLPAGSSFTRPQGGMNLWVRLPEPLDAGELLPLAVEQNVSYLPGRYFAAGRPDPGAFRLSFAGLCPADIEKGLKILGSIFENSRAGGRAFRRDAPAPVIV